MNSFHKFLLKRRRYKIQIKVFLFTKNLRETTDCMIDISNELISIYGICARFG